MTFKTTIEITPDDDCVHCGECVHMIEDSEDDADWCHAFMCYLQSEESDDMRSRKRALACLAAEKAAKDRPRTLQECPECKGAGWIDFVPGVRKQCAACYGGPVPGWVEVKP
jgi:hypothetical protein